MRKPHLISAWFNKFVLVSVLALSATGIALAAQESTIFTYDGKDFIRTYTTLVTEDGKSAVNTKLDHSNPAYSALIQKHAYTGEITVFGLKCDASYAPLIDKDGKLTGAVFVCIKK